MRRFQFPLWSLLVVVAVAACICAWLRGPGSDYDYLLVPFVFDFDVCAISVALLVLLPRLRPGQAFAAGYAAFSAGHLWLLVIEPLHWYWSEIGNCQLLTLVCSYADWPPTQPHGEPTPMKMVFLLAAMNIWGLAGGLLSLTINRRKVSLHSD